MALHSKSVRIVEVGPRDGLQNIKAAVPTSVKCELIEKLLDANFRTLELTSIVSAKAIPQLSDSEEVLRHPHIQKLIQYDEFRLPVLVPNLKGLKKAIELGVREVAVFISATEGFSQANINCTVTQGLQRAIQVTKEAKSAGLEIRGYVSCIFACPYDGPTPLPAVLRCVKPLLEAGCYEVSLGDTIGIGSPAQTRNLLSFLLSNGVPVSKLAGHFHDTYGQALANAWEAYNCGLRVFDSSVAGLGGCPFAPGARGNLASEDLAYMFKMANIKTGINFEQVATVGNWISEKLRIPNGSRAGVASIAKTVQPTKARMSEPKQPLARVRWSEVKNGDGLIVLRAGMTVKVILNRPENGNALTRIMMQRLTSLFKAYESDRTVFRIVLAARGKFFCTGMDLSKQDTQVAKGNSDTMDQYDLLSKLFYAIDSAPQVTIASINGPCYGGGVGLALSCDIRIASSSARMTLSEAKLGLVAATISKYVIREMGIPFAREAMLSARTIDADELKQRGIIARVARDPADLDYIVDEYADSLRQCAPRASTMSKSLVKLAWKAAGSQEQEDGVRRVFEEMMRPGAEASRGLAAFQAGQRNLDWDDIEAPRKAKL